MHVLFLTKNKEFLKEDGRERKLLDGLVDAAEVLHVVVLTRRGENYETRKINEHAWVYPTNSLWGLSLFSMLRVARYQVYWQHEFRAHVVYSDDVRVSAWAGALLALWYNKVWVVNVYAYEWGVRALSQRPFARLSVMPLTL